MRETGLISNPYSSDLASTPFLSYSIRVDNQEKKMATVNDLLTQVQELVKVLGPDAPIASFIITEADVVTFDDDGNEVEVGRDVATRVLNELEQDDFIHSMLNEKVDESIVFS